MIVVGEVRGKAELDQYKIVKRLPAPPPLGACFLPIAENQASLQHTLRSLLSLVPLHHHRQSSESD